MITFLRKIRKSLISSSSFHKYLLYAIGEITLVVIGILIALQINNWNEARKLRDEFEQSLLALSEDIRTDTIIIEGYIDGLQDQEGASRYLIPILENGQNPITDSMDFIKAFMLMSNASQIDMNTEIWDEIRTSGLHKKYGSPELIESIQYYYHIYKRYASNWENAYRTRIEMRELKYSFLMQRDLDLIRSRPPETPSNQAFEAILDNPDVLSLTKSISYSSSLFSKHFIRCKSKAKEVLILIEKELQSSK